MGHGHVIPNPDGSLARCGGPGLCAECSAERCRQEAIIRFNDRVAPRPEMTAINKENKMKAKNNNLTKLELSEKEYCDTLRLMYQLGRYEGKREAKSKVKSKVNNGKTRKKTRG